MNRRKSSPNAPGGLLEDYVELLRLGGHLTTRQSMAAVLFLRALQAPHGTSSGIVGEISERVDAGRRPRLWPPGGSPRANIVALDDLMKRLRPHERHLMNFVLLG